MKFHQIVISSYLFGRYVRSTYFAISQADWYVNWKECEILILRNDEFP